MLIHERAAAALVVVMTLVMLSGESAQSATPTLGPSARISFQSLQLTAAQFESGSKDGAPVTIAGDLSLPEREGRLPVVILFHGSAGITESELGWASLLPRMGIASFTVDSFTPRGIKGAPSEEQLSRAGQVIDAYRALELLATHPRIDRERIALMGFSRGGGQTLLAAIPRLRAAYLPPEITFAAYLAFYPTLRPTARLLAQAVPDRPTWIFHGLLDDSEPISNVRAYVERVRRDGANAQLFEFSGARHSFDNPSFTKMIRSSRGFTLGYDADAHRQAIQKVEEILTGVFGRTR